MTPLNGIHHVTAITGDAQPNVDFYAGLFGLRLVKKTVNFDDPNSYHLYYGDRIGSPGTLITFFVWPGAAPGRTGIGEPVATAFRVPAGSLEWWNERITRAGSAPGRISDRFGERALSISDPDGMRVELIESDTSGDFEFWAEGGVPRERAVRAIHGVSLAVRSAPSTLAIYTDELLFRTGAADASRQRFEAGERAAPSYIDLITPAAVARGRMGAGTIHHVAFRTADDATQSEWLRHIQEIGLHVSPVMDRKYFHSIYFRELHGVLFEIATDGPGMAVDEPQEHLGESLALPDAYERLRSELNRALPPIAAPRTTLASEARA